MPEGMVIAYGKPPTCFSSMDKRAAKTSYKRLREGITVHEMVQLFLPEDECLNVLPRDLLNYAAVLYNGFLKDQSDEVRAYYISYVLQHLKMNSREALLSPFYSEAVFASQTFNDAAEDLLANYGDKTDPSYFILAYLYAGSNIYFSQRLWDEMILEKPGHLTGDLGSYVNILRGFDVLCNYERWRDIGLSREDMRTALEFMFNEDGEAFYTVLQAESYANTMSDHLQVLVNIGGLPWAYRMLLISDVDSARRDKLTLNMIEKQYMGDSFSDIRGKVYADMVGAEAYSNLQGLPKDWQMKMLRGLTETRQRQEEEYECWTNT